MPGGFSPAAGCRAWAAPRRTRQRAASGHRLVDGEGEAELRGAANADEMQFLTEVRAHVRARAAALFARAFAHGDDLVCGRVEHHEESIRFHGVR